MLNFLSNTVKSPALLFKRPFAIVLLTLTKITITNCNLFLSVFFCSLSCLHDWYPFAHCLLQVKAALLFSPARWEHTGRSALTVNLIGRFVLRGTEQPGWTVSQQDDHSLGYIIQESLRYCLLSEWHKGLLTSLTPAFGASLRGLLPCSPCSTSMSPHCSCSTSHIPTRLISLTLSHACANCPIILPIALQAELAYSERTFRHLPEAKHGTGDWLHRGMKAWQVVGMQNKVWLHTGESMLHSNLWAGFISLPFGHSRRQIATKATTPESWNLKHAARVYLCTTYPTHLPEVVLWCTMASWQRDSSQHGQLNDS